MSEYVEIAARGGAATAFLILGLILVRDGSGRAASRLGALFAASAAVRVMCGEPFCEWLRHWASPLFLLSFALGAGFWLFARALFDDSFRMKRQDWAVLAGMIGLGTAWHFSASMHLPPFYFRIPFQTLEILLGVSAMWVAWAGRSHDLVEPRRRARLVFVTLTGAFLAVVTISYLAPGKAPPIVADIQLAGMFTVAIGLALAVVGIRDRETFGAERTATTAGFVSRRAAAIDSVNPAEARLLSRLRRLMEDERTYRQEGLTIGALAARLGAPEYLLRRLINQRLGFRNFSAYINSWRIAEARAALADPDQVEVPVSTIALDAGFSSLGPFNRAFRTEVGVTPTVFRQGLRAGPAQGVGSPDFKFG